MLQEEALRKRRRRQAPWRRALRKLTYLVVALAVVAGAVVGAFELWLNPEFVADPAALTRLHQAPLGESLVRVSATDASGNAIPVALRSGAVFPTGYLDAAQHVTVRVTVRRSPLVGWLLGRTQTVTAHLVTPAAPHLTAPLTHPSARGAVIARFDVPVARIAVSRPGARTATIALRTPQAKVDSGIAALGADRAGRAFVAAAARAWERLSAPARLTWFPVSAHTELLSQPAAGTAVTTPLQPLELTFSQPVAAAIGSRLPKLTPATPGRWLRPDPETLVFQPSGSGFGLGAQLRVAFPQQVDLIVGGRTRAVRSVGWSVPQGTTLRLQQLLAELGYLPVTWQPVAADTKSAGAEARAAIVPPPGRFSWRYPSTPTELKSLWNPTTWTTLTQGAVMAFEHDNLLTVDGLAGPQVWRTLLGAVIAGRAPRAGFSYVLVHRTVPQNLTLWHNGQVVLHALVNTGVPGAPTPYGTHAVFEHIPSGTMSGRNPGGTRYHDPGVQWISYFHGGEAIHGFNRPTYGFPQSVGCVEAPIPVAAKIWPYTPIGTLVTIEP